MQGKMNLWEVITLIMFGLISIASGVKVNPVMNYAMKTDVYIPRIRYSYDFENMLLAILVFSIIYLTIHIVGNMRLKKEEVAK
mgnify:CR=1 FL=1